jgi:hypothetical protein
MGEGPFDDEEQEGQCWKQLPLVPAVTGVLLRQQNRRRWKPAALAHMFARLPRLLRAEIVGRPTNGGEIRFWWR